MQPKIRDVSFGQSRWYALAQIEYLLVTLYKNYMWSSRIYVFDMYIRFLWYGIEDEFEDVRNSYAWSPRMLTCCRPENIFVAEQNT